MSDTEADRDDEVPEDAVEDAPGSGDTAHDVLEYLVKALVDEPDAVEIDTEDGRRGVSYRVTVGPDDMGRVIGRRGRNAGAIRTLVRAAAVRDGVEVDVDFVD